MISDGTLSDTAADFAQAQADEAARLRQMFLDVLDGMNVEEGSEGGERFSIKRTQKMNYDQQLDLFLAGKLNGSDSLYVGTPSEGLQTIGFSDAPLAMNQSDIRKSM